MPNPTYAPEPSEAHTKLLDDLGGPKAVTDAINAMLALSTPMTGQAVSNWKRRGIPWRFRGPLVVIAQNKDVATPADFFGINSES